MKRWKAVACSNALPLLTHDSHCTHRNTPQTFFLHWQLNNTAAAFRDGHVTLRLHSCLSCLYVWVCTAVCAWKSLQNQTLSAAHSLAASQVLSGHIKDTLRFTHGNINGEVKWMQVRVFLVEAFMSDIRQVELMFIQLRLVNMNWRSTPGLMNSYNINITKSFSDKWWDCDKSTSDRKSKPALNTT